MFNELAHHGGSDWIDRAWLQIGKIQLANGGYAASAEALEALDREAPRSGLKPEADLVRAEALAHLDRAAESEKLLKSLDRRRCRAGGVPGRPGAGDPRDGARELHRGTGHSGRGAEAVPPVSTGPCIPFPLRGIAPAAEADRGGAGSDFSRSRRPTRTIPGRTTRLPGRHSSRSKAVITPPRWSLPGRSPAGFPGASSSRRCACSRPGPCWPVASPGRP